MTKSNKPQYSIGERWLRFRVETQTQQTVLHHVQSFRPTEQGELAAVLDVTEHKTPEVCTSGAPRPPSLPAGPPLLAASPTSQRHTNRAAPPS